MSLSLVSGYSPFTSGSAYSVLAGVIAPGASGLNQQMIIMDSNNQVRCLNIPSMTIVWGPSSLPSGSPSDITMVTNGTAMVSNNGSGRVDFYNTSTGYVATSTAAALGAINANPGTISGNVNSGTAMLIKNGGYVFANSLTLGATSYAPSYLSSQATTCVCFKPDTQTWIFGTGIPSLIEVNQYGTILNTVTISMLPNTGTAQAVNVVSVAYSNGNVISTTANGIVRVHNWGTGSLLYKSPCPPSQVNSSDPTFLCQAASGWTIMGTGYNGGIGSSAISEVYFEGNNPTLVSNFFSPINTKCPAIALDPVNNKVYAFYGFQSYSGSRQLSLNSPVTKTVTDTQTYSGAIQVVSRILRIRDDGIGTACVEVDQNVAAGDVNVSCTDGRNYIEVSIVSSQFDIREFQG